MDQSSQMNVMSPQHSPVIVFDSLIIQHDSLHFPPAPCLVRMLIHSINNFVTFHLNVVISGISMPTTQHKTFYNNDDGNEIIV